MLRRQTCLDKISRWNLRISMEGLTMTFLNWLLVLLVVCLSSVTVLLIVLNHLERTRWMRISCERQGIPATSMEANRQITKELVQPAQDKRPRMSIPVPGADLFRKVK
jgi:hypothetical protein